MLISLIVHFIGVFLFIALLFFIKFGFVYSYINSLKQYFSEFIFKNFKQNLIFYKFLFFVENLSTLLRNKKPLRFPFFYDFTELELKILRSLSGAYIPLTDYYIWQCQRLQHMDFMSKSSLEVEKFKEL